MNIHCYSLRVYNYIEGQEPLNWAIDNCSGFVDVRATRINHNLYYHYYFSDERDLTLFALRWS